MALTFDLREVENHEALDPQKTQVLIFSTMAVGIGKITEDSYKEYWDRLQVLHAVYGDTGLTEDDVRQHVGLETNVFPKVSARKFQSNMAKSALERLLKEYRERSV